MGFRTRGAKIEEIIGASVGDFKGPQPTQLTVDPLVVGQYAAKIIAGEPVAAIEVVLLPDGREFITEGHHRFVAGELAGSPVDRKVFPNNGPAGFNWSATRYGRLDND